MRAIREGRGPRRAARAGRAGLEQHGQDRVTISVGGNNGDQRERDSSDFVNAADLALFRAKWERRRVPRLACRRREELRQAGPEL